MNENENEKKEAEVKTEAEDQSISQLTEALNDLKRNSVSKEDYQKVVDRNNELTKAIIDGSSYTPVKSESGEKPYDLQEGAKSLFEDGIGNLEYARRTLKFRDEYIKKYGKDPTAPNTEDMSDEDLESAQKVAEIMQDCIDKCGGSETIYNALLSERISADSPKLTAILRKRGLIKD